MAKRMLDLHGRRENEIPDLVDRFLTDAMSADFDQVRIMTGKGKGVVQAAVVRYLKLGKFSWVYEKLPNGKMNEGVLVVHI